MGASVFTSIRRQPPSSTIDLETVRATVGYMHDDARCTPGMERLAMAFDAVLREIDAAERAQTPQAARDVITARFLPFRR